MSASSSGSQSNSGPDPTTTGAKAPVPSAAEDFRRMAPTYAAVVLVELVVLLSLWWFQRSFS
jgi:hypothetical protein